MLKSTLTWWNSVKCDDEKLTAWLLRQYTGEVTAASRIKKFADTYAATDAAKKTLYIIADQEMKHAEWVKELLIARDIEPVVESPEDRYWSATLSAIESFETGAAVGAHAEGMRLQRIRTIVNDETAPEDIRDVFAKILKDEVFHERAFKFMAGHDAMLATLPDHVRGKEFLGLEP